MLQYFLAVAREQSISAAAASLHLSQPTLSTQLKALEDELGCQLLVRGRKGSRRVTLTGEGMLLRDRAEEILSLFRRTEQEIAPGNLAGEVCIAAGETRFFRYFARAAGRLRSRYPGVMFRLSSGNAAYVFAQLDQGLCDIGLVFGAVDRGRYGILELPMRDRFGVLMRPDSVLAGKTAVTPDDLYRKPLILSQQEERDGWPFLSWYGRGLAELDIAATYTLTYNAALLAREGVGYAVVLDGIAAPAEMGLLFKPLSPAFEAGAAAVWRKYPGLSQAAGHFLEELKREAK